MLGARPSASAAITRQWTAGAHAPAVLRFGPRPPQTGLGPAIGHKSIDDLQVVLAQRGEADCHAPAVGMIAMTNDFPFHANRSEAEEIHGQFYLLTDGDQRAQEQHAPQ